MYNKIYNTDRITTEPGRIGAVEVEAGVEGIPGRQDSLFVPGPHLGWRCTALHLWGG